MAPAPPFAFGIGAVDAGLHAEGSQVCAIALCCCVALTTCRVLHRQSRTPTMLVLTMRHDRGPSHPRRPYLWRRSIRRSAWRSLKHQG